jgi:predicted nucleic acid-binding protein
MKLMIDSNVFLDVLLDRQPYAEASASLLSLCENKKLIGFLSATSAIDIFYIVRRALHSNAEAYKALGHVLDIAKVCSVTNEDVLQAYQRQAADFEDCLLATCAQSNGCDYIVTRNLKDFSGCGIEAREPAEFL